jgi:hypothetical protein
MKPILSRMQGSKRSQRFVESRPAGRSENGPRRTAHGVRRKAIHSFPVHPARARVVATSLLTPDVVALAPDPGVVSVVAEPEVFALVFAAGELSPEVVVLNVEPGVVFVVAVSAADVAEPQACVHIAVAFDVLVPVSLFVVERDSSGRPKCLFPNVDHYASSSSSAEDVG